MEPVNTISGGQESRQAYICHHLAWGTSSQLPRTERRVLNWKAVVWCKLQKRTRKNLQEQPRVYGHGLLDLHQKRPALIQELGRVPQARAAAFRLKRLHVPIWYMRGSPCHYFPGPCMYCTGAATCSLCHGRQCGQNSIDDIVGSM